MVRLDGRNLVAGDGGTGGAVRIQEGGDCERTERNKAASTKVSKWTAVATPLRGAMSKSLVMGMFWILMSVMVTCLHM